MQLGGGGLLGSRAGLGSGIGAVPAGVDMPSPPDDTVSSVRWSPADCPMLLLGATSWDKTVRVWQVAKNAVGGGVQSQLMGGQNADAPVLCMAFAADGRVFYGGCCRTGQMWNLQTQQKQQVAAHDLPVSCMSYVNQGVAQEMLITGGWDSKIRFWDLRTPAPAKEETLAGPVVAMHVAGPMAAFATGRKIVVMNLQTLTRMGDLEPNAMMKYAFRDVACLANHSAVFTGSAEGRVGVLPLSPANAAMGCCFKAHCVETPNMKNHFTMYQTNFTAVVSGTGVSGGSDGVIRFWNLQGRTRIAEIPARMHNNAPIPISCGSLSSDCSMLAYGSSYDWSLGKDNFDPKMPKSVTILPVQPGWVR
jgi:mRNA export factor